MSRVDVQIDRLVVDGFSKPDGQAIAVALQQELELLLIEPPAVAHLLSLDGMTSAIPGFVEPVTYREPWHLGVATARRIAGSTR